jgi:hypothetical protein
MHADTTVSCIARQSSRRSRSSQRERLKQLRERCGCFVEQSIPIRLRTPVHRHLREILDTKAQSLECLAVEEQTVPELLPQWHRFGRHEWEATFALIARSLAKEVECALIESTHVDPHDLRHDRCVRTQTLIDWNEVFTVACDRHDLGLDRVIRFGSKCRREDDAGHTVSADRRSVELTERTVSSHIGQDGAISEEDAQADDRLGQRLITRDTVDIGTDRTTDLKEQEQRSTEMSLQHNASIAIQSTRR